MLTQFNNLQTLLKMEQPIAPDASTIGNEKRSEPRFETLQTATIYPVRAVEQGALTAYVMEISTRGMKVRVEREFRQGDLIQVILDDAIVLAEVRHCAPAHGRFLLGLSVQSALLKQKSSKRKKR